MWLKERLNNETNWKLRPRMSLTFFCLKRKCQLYKISTTQFKMKVSNLISLVRGVHIRDWIKKKLIKFLVPINIHSFVFSPYKIKSHFLVPVRFSLSILGNKNVDGKIL